MYPAILIAKHGSDQRLLLDALPVAERADQDNGGGEELVSIRVDAVVLAPA